MTTLIYPNPAADLERRIATAGSPQYRQGLHLQVQERAANDEDMERFLFRITNESQDRHQSVIHADGWEMDNFKKNPSILCDHEYRTRQVVGKAVNLSQKGKEWQAEIEFNTLPIGRDHRQLVLEDNLRAVSVGFMPIAWEWRDKDGKLLQSQDEIDADSVLHYTRQELWEVSFTPVPSNYEALRLRGLSVDGGEAAARFGAPMSPMVEQMLERLSKRMTDLESAVRALSATPSADQPPADEPDGRSGIELTPELAALRGWVG